MSDITYFKGREMARFWRFRNIPYTDFTFISSRCKEIWSKPIKLQPANLYVMREIISYHHRITKRCLHKEQEAKPRKGETYRSFVPREIADKSTFNSFRPISISKENDRNKNYITSRLKDRKKYICNQSNNSKNAS